MAKYSPNSEDSILEVLISLPSKGLESKIGLLKEEILKRKTIGDEILSTLFTQNSRISDQLQRLRYLDALNSRQSIKQDFLKTRERILNRIAEEKLTRQKDIMEINYRLLELRSELESSRLKAKLLK